MKKCFTLLLLAMALFAGTTSASAQETLVVDGSTSYLWKLQQGADYILPGTDGTWYCQPGFFTHKAGDVWTFQAYDDAEYAYAIQLDEAKKYIDVVHLNATSGEGVDAAPAATFSVNKAIWLNGNQNIGFPSYAINKINWAGGADVPVPQVADGVYRLQLVAGEQIDPTSINFKFFMGKNWGGDMGTSVLWLENNDYVYMGQQDGNSGDNGNIYGVAGANIGELDTLVVTIDMNNMHGDLGTITVEKKAYTPATYPQLNGQDMEKYGSYFYWTGAIAKGQTVSVTNLDAVDLPWDVLYVDEVAATKGADGQLTLNVIDGNYTLAFNPAQKALKIFPGTLDAPATYEANKALWIIGARIGQPSAEVNNCDWNVGVNRDIPVAQIEPNVYKVTLTVGKEITSDINFKFFGQAGWGYEFRGEDLQMEDNDYLILKQPEWNIGYDENGNETLEYGDEDGNIRNGVASLANGDKLVLTIDLNNYEQHYFDPIQLDVICKRGTVNVEYIPYGGVKPTFNGVTMTGDGDWYFADLYLSQGQSYTLENLLETEAEDLYTDPCFATYNGDGKFKFNAISGSYCVLVNEKTKYLKMWPGTYQAPAGIHDGGLWIIGEGFGRPSVNGNAAGWNTGKLRDFAVAQTAPGIFQMDLTCDVEMWDNWCNYKFFGQPDWGIEFKPGTDYSIVAAEGSLYLAPGEGDGNIGFLPGASFVKGEPIYIVIDFTEGLDAGVMYCDNKPIETTGINTVTTNATEAIYTLQGQRLNNASQRGIYIVGGRKVVKK